MLLTSSYFNRSADPWPNPGLKSAPSTRPMSALPLVTILRGQGLRQVVRNLRAPLVAIGELAQVLRRRPGVQVCHRPDTGILCFRITPPGMAEAELDGLQQQLYEAMLTSGERSVSLTRLAGRTVLRLVAVAPHVSVHQLRQTVTELQKLATSIRTREVV
jgi:L-2,4-diaminobutyrate decarboxylase